MLTPKPFVIFALPRSRTAWLAHFLGQPEGNGITPRGHDRGIECDTLEDFFSAVRFGTVETGAQDAWKAVRYFIPEAKILVIRRKEEEVVESFAAKGIRDPELTKEIYRRGQVLDELSASPGVKTLAYQDLTIPWNCSWLYEWLLGEPLAPTWWQQMEGMNVQLDLGPRFKRLDERQGMIEGLKAELASLPDYPRPFFPDVAIGLEPWLSLWPEILPLAEAHFREVETTRKRPFELNCELMSLANKIGMMPMVSARVRGKLVGYCTWNIASDVECRNLKIVHQGGWYVAPGHEGLRLGIRMLRESLALLRKAGINEAYLHHREGGRGARLGRLFSRLGAQPIQRTYYLPLEGLPDA